MLKLLVQHTLRAAQSEEAGARELANMAYGAARSGEGNSLSGLFAPLAGTAQRRMSGFTAQDLANTGWAFAMSGQLDTPLFAALVRPVERCVRNFTAQNLANTVWAFVSTEYLDTMLFAALARAAERHLRTRRLNPMNR